MTYQLNLKQSSNPNQTKNWFFVGIFSFIMIASILSVYFVKNISLILALNTCFLAIAAYLIYQRAQKSKLPYIRIQDSKLEYYCLKEQQIVSISADEITHITHRFCELRVHTKEQVHLLSLEPVRKERKRWEIKEMINQWAQA